MHKIFGFSGGGYDAVRIVQLGDEIEADHAGLSPADIFETSDEWRHKVVDDVVVSPADAAPVLDLWNALAAGDHSRCHIPLHGFELISHGRSVFTVAICFQCNSAHIGGRLATERWRSFNAQNRQAIAFRAALDRFFPKS
ncbi:hypothetical protein ACFSCV_03600 [Methylopila henanensis]|uniref:Uncharacterized protein n=1 Tax=Methylopila henanensis TaxID=873516 RepID=A0ABW4K2W6_9HYPH